MVLSVCVVMHVLVRYQRERASGAPAAAAVDEIEAHVFLPAALTAATTVIGFVSLLVSPIPSVRTFGLFSALGAAVAFVLGAVAVPAALRVLRPGRARRRPRPPGALLAGIARLLGAPRGSRARRAAALSRWPRSPAPAAARLDARRRLLPADHALNRAYDFIEARLGGITPLEVVFESERPGGLRDPGAIAALRSSRPSSMPSPRRCAAFRSPTGSTRRATRSSRRAARAAARRRRASSASPSCSRRCPRDDLPYWVRDDWRQARLSTRSIGSRLRAERPLLLRVEAAAREALAGRARRARSRSRASCPCSRAWRSTCSRARSAPSAIALLSRSSRCSWLLLRSFGWALVAMVPNVVPCC